MNCTASPAAGGALAYRPSDRSIPDAFTCQTCFELLVQSRDAYPERLWPKSGQRDSGTAGQHH